MGKGSGGNRGDVKNELNKLYKIYNVEITGRYIIGFARKIAKPIFSAIFFPVALHLDE